MAATIELVQSPTGGAPLNTDDYNAQNVLIQAMLNQYMAGQLHLTQWDTLVEPGFARYIYIMHGGALFQVKGGDYIIADPGVIDGRVYIKVERIGNELTAEFTNSAVGYLWNFVYNGFYHADGSQLLPYVLYLDSGDWNKYYLNSFLKGSLLLDDLLLLGNFNISDVLSVNDKIDCVENNDDVSLFFITNGNSQEFFIKYPLTCYLSNTSADTNGYLDIYQIGGYQNIYLVQPLLSIFGIMLNPGKYKLKMAAGSGGVNLACTGVYGKTVIDSGVYST